MSLIVTALLGRKDEPTDAVEEYCRYLSRALEDHEIQLDIRRVPWEIHGWSESLNVLKLMATHWRGAWVLVQYTALAWSSRGFPQKVLRVLKILKSAGARVGIVFHDVEPYPGTHLVDSIRRFLQVRTMRRALALCDLAIFTVPPEKLSWIPASAPRSEFIPVGANLPISADSSRGLCAMTCPRLVCSASPVANLERAKHRSFSTRFATPLLNWASCAFWSLAGTPNFAKACCRMACVIFPWNSRSKASSNQIRSCKGSVPPTFFSLCVAASPRVAVARLPVSPVGFPSSPFPARKLRRQSPTPAWC